MYLYVYTVAANPPYVSGYSETPPTAWDYVNIASGVLRVYKFETDSVFECVSQNCSVACKKFEIVETCSREQFHWNSPLNSL